MLNLDDDQVARVHHLCHEYGIKVSSIGSPVGKYVEYVHVKDAFLVDGRYQGFLAPEPHLTIAGHSSGFSGPDGMASAASALRKLMAEVGCVSVASPC